MTSIPISLRANEPKIILHEKNAKKILLFFRKIKIKKKKDIYK